MHEFSTAQNIARVCVRVAMQNNAKKITQINLEIGEFTFINPDQLRFVFKIAAQGNDVVKDAYLNITKMPGAIRCNKCGYEGAVTIEEDPKYHTIRNLTFGLDCPKCKNNNTELIGGRELNIKDIKVET